MSAALVWLRRDLRLADQPALAAACATHDRVLPVYVYSPHEEAPWQPGAASRWWLHHSLQAFQRQLDSQGGQLHIASGDSLDCLRELIARSKATAVYWTRLYEPAAIRRDTAIKSALRADGIAVESLPGNLWCEPWKVATAGNQPYRVFTLFWHKLHIQLPGHLPLPPAKAREWLKLSGSASLASRGLLPRIHWDAGLATTWHPGESGAHEQLELFVSDVLAGYARERDLPGRPTTSRLSPHLHFGEITPLQILHALRSDGRNADRCRHADRAPFLRALSCLVDRHTLATQGQSLVRARRRLGAGWRVRAAARGTAGWRAGSIWYRAQPGGHRGIAVRMAALAKLAQIGGV